MLTHFLSLRRFLQLGAAALAVTAAGCKKQPEPRPALRVIHVAPIKPAVNPLAGLEAEPFYLLDNNGLIKSESELNKMLKDRAKRARLLLAKSDSKAIVNLGKTLEAYAAKSNTFDLDLIDAYKEAGAHYEALMVYFKDFAVAAAKLGAKSLDEDGLRTQIEKQRDFMKIAALDETINKINDVLYAMFPPGLLKRNDQELALRAILERNGLSEVHNPLAEGSSEFDMIKFAPSLDEYIFQLRNKFSSLRA